MKILAFIHHPDVFYYMYRAFTALGHEVHAATEDLTKQIGFRYSSVKQNKLEVVDQLFDPAKLYSDLNSLIFSDSFSGYDMYWSMLPEITSLGRHSLKTWFDGQMQIYLRYPGYRDLEGIKSANHPDAWELNKFHFVGNWVPQQPKLVEKKFITQLVTECDKVDTTPTLLALKAQGLPVKIHGGPKCPDGFIRDVQILPHTALLVHNKQFGINCYAVCKALDMGIPVYMSRQTKNMIGFDDLPDNLFYFQEDWKIEDAYKDSLDLNPKVIQDIYRSIYTLDRTTKQIGAILDSN